MAKIVLTGGGTAGHVTANLALIPGLLERKHQLFYMGSEKGIEKEFIDALRCKNGNLEIRLNRPGMGGEEL